VANEPFIFRFAVTGLTPSTQYEMTARLRRSDSTSDQGSFTITGSFGTSYQAIGPTDATGAAAGWVWLKPGTATAYSAIRLRLRVAGTTSTPNPLDVEFTRTVLPITAAGSVSGTVYDSSGQPLADARVRVIDEQGDEVETTSTDSSGKYLIFLAPSGYLLRAFDLQNIQLGTDLPVSVVAGQSITTDLNPAPPPPPKIYPDSVRLSELLPNPIGTDADGEFIELENTASDPVDLTGWTLTDASGTKFQLKGNIGAGSFLAIPFSETKITLNNSAESITLMDPNLQTHDEISYADAPEGESWARDGDDWRWSLQPTPGAANLFPLPPPPPVIPVNSIAQLRASLPVGEVAITGVVTASTDRLGSHIAYLQDGTGGIQVYSSKLTLARGQAIGVSGILSSYHNELRLKADQQTDLGPGTQPRPVPVRLLDESVEGRLVTVEGQITKLDGGTFTLSTVAGDVRIVLHSSTGVKRPKMHSGDIWRIEGIVSQFSNKDPRSGYRLLPQALDDFVLIKAFIKPKKTVEIPDVDVPVTVTQQLPPPLIAEAGIRVERRQSRPYRGLGVIITLLGIANTGFLIRRDSTYQIS
jgi:DNA/RNA endonuclease YhcR with UshA esterase domain